jgi:hypothetical protein
MPKEDYLQKYLEKLSRVIAAMLGFRDKGFPEDALRLVDGTYKELLDVDLDELAIMPVDEFIAKIKKESYTATHLELLAQLTRETAISYTSQNKTDLATIFYAKSLQLYYLLNEKDKTFSFEREQIMNQLIACSQL